MQANYLTTALTVLRLLFFWATLTLLPYIATAQSEGIIFGKVMDSDGTPVEYANVYIRAQNAGTTTDDEGNYRLKLTPGKNIEVEISHTAFRRTSKMINLEPGENLEIDFELQNIEIGGVVIEDRASRKASMINIPMETIKYNPSVNQGIERMLSGGIGVSSTNELSSNYSVRGGSYAENLVYVNGIEVYRPFLTRTGQQEGLSFPNPDMVGSILFSAGGWEAKYGDKMSSVLDIQYKKPEKFGGSFSASLLGGSISLENASDNRRLTQITGIRYRTNQYILGALDTDGDYQPNFTDIQTYWTYDISDKVELSFLGNYSNNSYRFIPQSRQTDFGTINEALRFTVYFEGEESTTYETLFGALSADIKPNSSTLLKFTSSVYQTYEEESIDVLGEYYLDELERDMGNDDFGEVVRNRGTGGFLEHSRNKLDALVAAFSHRGFYEYNNKYLQWGVSAQFEEINDKLSEWTMVDSSGYSVPRYPHNQIVLQDVIKGNNNLISSRVMAYVQNGWDWNLANEAQLTATVGLRANYWDLNDQTVLSPRASLSYKPKWIKHLNDSTIINRDILFRFSTGYYYQPAFYRELRGIDGALNTELRAQRSIHFVLGADYNFLMWQRPFKFITEAYYKKLDDLVPYEIDNVRLRYYANNDAEGYAAGLDFKIHGEFIKGIESWANLSFLKTEEDIINDYYYDYYNDEGVKIIPGYTANNMAVDSVYNEPGKIPRPTDQRIIFSMFFQDEMPKIPSFKVHLNVVFATGLPFGPPTFERYKDVQRLPSYRRVDIGFSKDLMPKEPKSTGLFSHLNSAFVSLEVFNLLGISNTVSYTFVRESGGRQYGIPDYLTSRRLNLKLAFTF